MSLITFANDAAALLMPLTAICAAIGEFDPARLTELSPSGDRRLGDGLRLLEERYTNEVRTTTAESKGDWKAQLFVFCGG